MEIITTIKLDFSSQNNMPRVFAKQNDEKSRYIRIEPYNNGAPLKIPDGTVPRFACRKPDGTQALNDYVYVEDNVIVVELSKQTLAVAGTAKATIILFDDADKKILSSQNFMIEIQEDVLIGTKVTSSDEYQSYLAALLRPSAPYYITITKDSTTDTGYVCDKLGSEIAAAYADGRTVVARYGKVILALTEATSSTWRFSAVVEDNEGLRGVYTVIILGDDSGGETEGACVVYSSAYGKVLIDEDILFGILPCLIPFYVTISEDGSCDKTVEELQEIYQGGGEIACILNSTGAAPVILPLSSRISESEWYFAGSNALVLDDITGGIQCYAVVRTNDAGETVGMFTTQLYADREEFRNTQTIVGTKITAPETAEVGQTIVVKSVDENGKPTEWEAADLPAEFLSNDEQTLILSLFRNAVFDNVDMSVTLNQLENLFAGNSAIEYAVTYNLTGVTSDNDATVVKAGFPYTATLTVADGLELNIASLAVVMSGEDITESVYSDGVISIPCVTGEIFITAESKEDGLIYDLGTETVFDGTNSVDTGIHLFDTYKNFTLAFEFTSSSTAGRVFNEIVDEATNPDAQEFGMLRWGDGNWTIRGFGNNRTYIGETGIATNMKCVIILTSRTAGTVHFRNNGGDVISASFGTSDVNGYVGTTKTLKLGMGAGGADVGFVGTIHSFSVYEKVFDEVAINGFMGVA